MSTAINERFPYRLLAPGPVAVPPAVLQAMSRKVLHHRTPEFLRVLEEVWAGLKTVFETRQPVMILTGTGTCAMEATVVNTLSAGDEALVVVSGKFGERWAEICERLGVKVTRFNVPWGRGLVLDEFVGELKTHHNLRAVFSQVSETSTATVHPIAEMAAAVRAYASSALFAVDAMTGVGCMPLPMDQWDLDVVVAGSQKAFMLPTGLSFIALSERAWEAQARARLPKYYLDLGGEKKANAKGDSQFSISTPLIIGLNVVLERICRPGGLDRLIRRCSVLSEVTRHFGESALGLKVYSESPSPSVTALMTPEGTDSGELREWLERERNITIMGGQDQLKGKILRIGHMGDVRNEDMVALIQALAERLDKPMNTKMNADLVRRLDLAEALF